MKSDISQWLVINDEVRRVIENKGPVVALESTLITHGLPYPDNVKIALEMESEVRKIGATPATIAILGGIIAFLFERFQWFQRLSENARFWVIGAFSIGLPVIATALILYVPAEVWVVLEPLLLQ